MLKVKAGDIDKLGLLYERYQKKLFGFFWRMSGSVEVSEDLVQTVFYRILRSRTQYRGKGKFSSWMYQIAHHAWADHYKKNHPIELKDNLERWELKEGLSADEQIEKEEEMRQLRAAIQNLSPDKKEVLVMSRFHGLKYSEIAKILNTTEGAVKVKMFRAMNDLRKQILKVEK